MSELTGRGDHKRISTGSDSDGIEHASWVYDRVATARRSDTAMRANRY